MLPARNSGPLTHLAQAIAPAKNLILRYEKIVIRQLEDAERKKTIMQASEQLKSIF